MVRFIYVHRQTLPEAFRDAAEAYNLVSLVFFYFSLRSAQDLSPQMRIRSCDWSKLRAWPSTWWDILMMCRSTPVADPGGQGGHAPCLVKNRPKKMAAKCGSYISCFLAPLSEVSGSATATLLKFHRVWRTISHLCSVWFEGNMIEQNWLHQHHIVLPHSEYSQPHSLES